MKLSFIFAFVISMVFAQTNTREFQITTFIAGNEHKKEVKSVELEINNIDLKFIKKHFFVPYYLPDGFENKNYKNETIVVWYDENKKNNYTANWTNTYKYDGLSRITEYAYSGCTACSNFPYNYKVTYNSKGQVTELKNTISEKQSFEIKYNTKGEIIELKSCNQNGKTEKLIETL